MGGTITPTLKGYIKDSGLKSAVEALAFTNLNLNDSGFSANYRIAAQDGRIEYFPVLGGTVEFFAYVSDLSSYVQTSAMQAALSSYERLLPSQTGNSGKYLTTDGTAKSWATIDLSTKQDAAAFLTTLVGIGGTSGSGNLARVGGPTFTGTLAASVIAATSYIQTSAYFEAATQVICTAGPGARINSTGIKLGTSGYTLPIGWTGGDSNSAIRTGMVEASSGVVEINNGTVGTLRDLSLRNVTASGTVDARTATTGHRLGHLGHQDSVTLGWPGSSYGTFQAGNNGGFTWLSGALGLWYQSASVMQISNSSTVSNALGSLSCAQVNLGTATEFIQLGGTLAKVIGAYSNALGYSYQLIGDSTSSGGPMLMKLGSGATFDWMSTARADTGTRVARISQSGGTVQIGATGSTDGSLACLNGTFGGTLNVTGVTTFATNVSVSSGQLIAANVQVGSGGYLFWAGKTSLKAPTNGSLYITNLLETAGVTLDVTTDSTLKIRDRANAVDGSLACANIVSVATTGDNIRVTGAGGSTWALTGELDRFSIVDRTSSLRVAQRLNTSGAWTFLGSSHEFRNASNSTFAPILTGDITASGTVSLTGSGTVAAPVFTLGDTGTGFFKVGTNQTGWSVNGSELVRFATGNIFYCFGDITVYQDLIFQNAGRGIKLKSGTGARAGNATLVAGTVTITNTTVTANTIVYLTVKTAGGTVGTLTYTLSAGTSFTINSSSVLDTSIVSYILIELN